MQSRMRHPQSASVSTNLAHHRAALVREQSNSSTVFELLINRAKFIASASHPKDALEAKKAMSGIHITFLTAIAINTESIVRSR